MQFFIHTSPLFLGEYELISIFLAMFCSSATDFLFLLQLHSTLYFLRFTLFPLLGNSPLTPPSCLHFSYAGRGHLVRGAELQG
jgi:hypothetical protein